MSTVRVADNWTTATLAEFVTPDAPIGYGIVQVGPNVAGGTPVIAIRDLSEIVPERLHRASKTIEDKYRRSRVKPRDILISVKGTTGRIGIVPPGISCNISRDVARLRLREDQCPDYWLHLLRSDIAQRALDQAVVGTTRQELSIIVLRRLSFSVPPKEIQKPIAEALGDVDSLDKSLELLVAKKRDIKQGMLQEFLSGRTRLPGHSSPWVTRRVAEIATINKGVQLGRAQMDATGVVPVWNGGTEPSGFTSLANVKHSVVTVSEGGNSCGWVGRPAAGFWLGGHCYALLPTREGHSVSFLYHRMKSVESSIMSLRVGSGLPNIQKKRLSDFLVALPTDPSEAAGLAAILDDVDDEIHALERRLESARAIKQGMMQELLTGRTRLPVKEAVA